jgi:hypothetical protein
MAVTHLRVGDDVGDAFEVEAAGALGRVGFEGRHRTPDAHVGDGQERKDLGPELTAEEGTGISQRRAPWR